MILDENSSSWTATEVEPATTSDLTVLESVTPVGSVEPENQILSRLGSPARVGAARLVAQIIAIVVVALLAGLAVFFVIRTVAGSNDGGRDGTDQDADGESVIEPGPGDADPPTSSRSGTRRSEADDGPAGPARSSSEDGESQFASSNLTVTDETATRSGTAAGRAGQTTGVSQAGSSADPSGPTGSSTSIQSSTGPGPPSHEANASGSVTTAGPTAGNLSTIKPNTPAVPSTFRQTTTSKPATTSKPSTTSKPTTTVKPTTTSIAPLLPDVLVVLPSAGSVQSWNTGTQFRANKVPGATTFCWTIVAVQQTAQCGSDRSFDLLAGALVPGPATALAEALDGDGRVLLSQRIPFDLLATTVLRQPEDGEAVRDKQPLRLRSNEIPSATNYCWIVSQGGYNSGEFCDPDGGTNLSPKSDIRRSLTQGPATVQGRVYRRGTLIGRQSVAIDIESD